MTFLGFSKVLSRGVVGVVGLSAIAVLGVPQSAKAAAECGLFQGTVQGADWVSKCPEGIDHFHESWAILLVEFLPNNIFGVAPGTDQFIIGGPAWITREAGNNGVINTTIFEKLDGIFANIPLTLTGNGTGAITDPDGDGFAESFFDVFTQIDVNLPSGSVSLGSPNPFRVTGDRKLTGVSPDMIIPDPIIPTLPPDRCLYSPPVAIAYCGNTPTDLYLNGDPTMPVGIRILAETHTVHPPIPEPSNTAAIAILGLGSLVVGIKRKRNLIQK